MCGPGRSAGRWQTGSVVSFQEKPAPGKAQSKMINTGIYVFSPEVFDYIPETGEYDIGSQLLPDLVRQGVKFIAHEAAGTWLDVGKLEDIHVATAAILRLETDIRPARQRFRQAVWIREAASVDPAGIVCRGELFVDNGAIIENKAVIDGTCSVGRNCVVRSGAVLRRTQILGSHLEIPGGLRLQDKIVTDRYVISADGVFQTLEESGIRDVRSIADQEKLARVG